MIIKKGKKYQLDIRPNGSKGKRIIKLFNTKLEAVRYQFDLVSRLSDSQAVQAPLDDRHLSELIIIWFDLHGRSLKSAVDTKQRLIKLSENIGNPKARLFNSSEFALYRKQRLDSGINEATLNRELSTLKALFRELKRLEVIDYESSLLTVRKLKEKKTELTYLTQEQITQLRIQVFLSQNESLEYVVLICLITGARWSEAEGLTIRNCFNNGFSFDDTKNGCSRFVPVSEVNFLYIKNRLERGEFKSCYSAFRSAFNRCGFPVSPGQLAHILRHSFASHFTMNGGNIRALQKILGHSSLQMTMRYSHLSPAYMNQVVELNPLSVLNNENIKSGKKVESLSKDAKKPVEKNP